MLRSTEVNLTVTGSKDSIMVVEPRREGEKPGYTCGYLCPHVC